MDILNWVYLLKSKLIKTTVQDPEKDLIVLGNNVSWAKRGDKYQSYGMTVQDFAAAVGGLQGESYILVKGNNPDPVVNGAELKAAYDIALAATPYGNSRTIGNEFSVIIGPGTYDMRAYNTTFGWELTGDYINMISLTGESDVVISTFCVGGDYGTYKGLNTQDASAAGLGATGQILMGGASKTGITANFENCLAGDYSFGAGLSIGGSFKNCTAGNYSFGTTVSLVPTGYIQPPQNSGVISGSSPLVIFSNFENCTAGTNSFGSTNTVSSFVLLPSTIFRNCKAGGYSFGFSYNSVYINEATFIDCTVINSGNSFGSSLNVGNTSIISISSMVTFTNCKLAAFGSTPGNSFGYIGGSPGAGSFSIAGTFDQCTAGDNSFGYTAGSGTLSGTFKNCSAGNNSFGSNTALYSNVTASGYFENCLAGINSFGLALASGYFVNCISGRPGYSGGSSFGYAIGLAAASGTFISCISGGKSFGSGSVASGASGAFYSCVAGSGSFANNDVTLSSNLTGKALYCHKNAGSFYASPGGAKAILCIDSALTVQTI